MMHGTSEKHSGGLDVGGLLTLGPLGYFKADLLTLFKGLESAHVDRREVCEQVSARFH